MRRSQRINSDITKLILDGEEIFDIEDVHDSVVREDQSKIGASKKRTIKTEVYNVEETKSDSEEEYDFSDFLEEEEEVEGGKTVKSQPKTKTKSKSKAKVKSQAKTLSRKKLNRSGQFFPSLDKASCDSQYKYNSLQHWRNFITEENKSIKRKKNRLFRTKMTSYDFDTAANQLNLKLKQSSFDIQYDLKHGPKPGQCRLKIGGFLLPDSTSTILSPTEAIFRSSSDIFAICFCQCARCQRRTEENFSKNTNSSKEIYFFVACSKEISIFAMILDPLNGITLAEKKGRIVLNSEDENRFVTMSVVQSLLCISTQQQFYFFECETFRSMNCEFIMSIDDSVPSPSPTPTYTYTQYGQINCHAWRDGKLAIGTSNGRLYVLNSEFKEIFQFSAPNEAPICSLDWMNSFSILFAGRFSKIYSVDIRDPHYMMVEVSTLDGENHGRRLEKSVNLNSDHSFHQPLGTFDSMVLDLACSPFHSIIASSSASGSIHLSWMPEESRQSVEFEKKIVAVLKQDDGSVSIDFTPKFIKFNLHDTLNMYSSDMSCTSLAWCPDDQIPGLLIGGYRNGLIVAIITDRFFI